MNTDNIMTLNKVRALLNIFCAHSKGLNICTLNARSIRSKIDELRVVFSGSDIHAILVSETWLNTDMPSSQVSIPGYNLFRNDRSNRGGGGVKSFLKSRPIFSSANPEIEFLCVEVSTGTEKCVLSSVYSPPNQFNLENACELENCFSGITQRYSNVVVGGDFNVNILRRNLLSNQFLHLLLSVHLDVVNSQPTYFNTNNPSLLDLLLTTDSDKVLRHSQISPPSILDHDILFLSYDLPLNSRITPESYSYRDYGNINAEALFEECLQLPWYTIFRHTSVDEQVEIFSSQVRYLYDKYVPIKTKSCINRCPWFSQHLCSLIAEREYLYHQYKSLRTEGIRALYRAARNRVTTAIRRAKRQFFSNKLNCNLQPKVLWRNLRQAAVYGKDNPTCVFNPDDLNFFFTSTTRPPDGARVADLADNGNELNAPPRPESSESFSFHGISFDEMVLCINSIKSEAIGPDNLSPRFIKLLLPLIGKFILHILNTCLMSSSFPSAWRVATVLPIAKKPQPEAPSDFRPISILCFLSKVLEKLMYTQMLDFVEGRGLLTRWQSGFRSSHSCETAVLKVSTDIRIALDENKFSTLALLDFSKAFDSVDHNLLLRKLSTLCRFSAPAINLIKEFLSHRLQKVKADHLMSDMLPILRGVPQGSVLGPLLFSLFINDLPQTVHDVKIHLYADDVQLYLCRPIGLIEDCIERINRDLARINRWSLRNGLILNPGKSQCIAFYSGNLDVIDIPPVVLNGYILPLSNKVSNLGLILNREMKCCDNVNAIIGKVYAGLRRLWLSASILPRNTRMKLVKTLIMPFFTFGSTVFPKLDSVCARKIEVAFNNCVRFIFGLRRYDHVSPYKTQLVGCPLASFLKHRALIFLFNIIRTGKPGYLREYLQFSSSPRNNNIIIHQFNKSVMESSFLVQVARLWNTLPQSTQTVGSVNAFKKLIKSHIP